MKTNYITLKTKYSKVKKKPVTLACYEFKMITSMSVIINNVPQMALILVKGGVLLS
jgi:uncharacterized ion transporter superfamily protein YfcC